ncbi:uncharacterized protein CELE_C08B6.6 [Caenorhabditis elegans]|uniref:Secreted protein n=1 Tax=Caenorhabditis elegans TaxID=6239 RepID=Q17822_CAEEL|nr:Secreted protein [Caenorhabditis elegans]CAA96593.2 Secreted protein [Caenorhabditis elegans]|eukprot:NP_505602.2 Uncharacterized protein CELE_C08B6.6 [Caenorhabditis elegans]
MPKVAFILIISYLLFYNSTSKTLEDLNSKYYDFQESDTDVNSLEQRKLISFLNFMKDNDRELLISRIRIDEEDNSLSKFLVDAWELGHNFQFETFYNPIYVLCRCNTTNTLHRREGVVLEVVAKNEKSDKFERHKWIAIFLSEKETGYYLEYVEHLGSIKLENVNSEFESVFIINSIYECPSHKQFSMNTKNSGKFQNRDNIISKHIEHEWTEREYEV